MSDTWCLTQVSDTEYYVAMEAWIRTFVVVFAVGLVGLIGNWQASSLISVRGALGPTILQTISPVSSVVAVLITVGIASIVGGFIAKMTSSTVGMFILGFSLFAMALKVKGVEEFVINEGNYTLLILEIAFLSVIVLLGTLVVFGIGGPLKCIQKSEGDEKTAVLVGKAMLISLVVLPIVWLIANSPSKGQVIGAAALGGILIGILARQVLQSMQPLLLFCFPIAFGGLGYVIGLTISEPTVIAFTQRTMSPLLFPMPLEYAAGVILGLSIGLGWTSSITESTSSEEHKTACQKSA